MDHLNTNNASQLSRFTSRQHRIQIKYKTLKKRIERSIKSGLFYQYSKRRQQSLLQRLQRYYQRLLKWGKVAAGTAAIGTGVTTLVQAQTFTQAESPFNYFNQDAPFGLTAVASRSMLSFVDIDGDGDLDAFIGDKYGSSGQITFFENTSTNSSIPAFALPNNQAPFGLVNVDSNAAPFFVDIDGDGDFDAFVGEDSGKTNFFENTGNSTSPAFVLSTSSAPFGLTNIGTQAAPAFVDIDGDNDLDAFIGESDGNTNFFLNTSMNSSIPAFTLSTSAEPFGLTDVGDRSKPTFADIDGDGDLDAFIGEDTEYGKINFFRNTGDSATPTFSLSTSAAPFGLTNQGAYAAPTFADIDGDGDLDAFVGHRNGKTYYFKNTGTTATPSFTLVPDEVGNSTAPALVDIDGDGDLDAFVGEYAGKTNFFENTSMDSSVPAFSLSSSAEPFGLTEVDYNTAPTLVDIDEDGDLDAFIGQYYGFTKFFRNTSANSSIPAFSLSPNTAPFGLVNVGEYAAPTFVDIDGDGDLDAFIGEFEGNINYFENTSSNSSIPAFSLSMSSEPFGLTKGSNASSPTFVDIDGDGDLDAFVGTANVINYFENTSTNSSIPAFALSTSAEPFGLSAAGNAHKLVILDIDGDGLFEAVVGNSDGELKYFESDISSNGANCSLDDLTFGSGALASGDYSGKQTLTAASTIETTSVVEFVAGQSITLKTDFHAKDGSTFTARLADCTAEEIQNIPQEEFALATAVTSSTVEMTLYPNPTKSETMIEFNITEAGNASLDIYSTTGKLVQRLLAPQWFDEGSYQQRLTTKQLQSGMYIVLLRTDSGILTTKLLVMD